MERRIAETIASAGGTSVSKLGLRFDRVVVRVLGDLARVCEAGAPAGVCVLVTISAPIRLPAKTVAILEREIDARLTRGPIRCDDALHIHGNGVRLRLVEVASDRSRKFIGFVHNPDTDATRLLDLAEAWLQADR
jgi:hypothetical protein